MPKASWSPAVKQRVSSFLKELLSYVLDYRDDLQVQYRWEDEYSNRPKLIFEAKRRFLEKLAKLEKQDHFYEIINRLKDLNLYEERRGVSLRGKDDWHFGLKLWSKDKQKNLREFDYVWESKRPEKSKKVDRSLEQSKILGKLCIQVPDLPMNFLPRLDELKKVKSLLFDSGNRRVAVTGISHRLGLQGMGGIGKSVLAAILAHDKDVRTFFPDGILWVTLGQQPVLTLRQLDLAKMLGDNSQIFQDVQQGRVHLSQLLADKACLLILDDVWQSKHAEAFNVLGQQSKILITTRDSKVLKELGAVEHTLGLLKNEEALELLALWAKQEKAQLPFEAQEVVQECGKLPLALAMIGAIVTDKPDRWGNVLHKLRNADLEKIRHQFFDYPYPDLLKAMQVSVEALESDLQKRYLDFAVFPEDTPIPEAVLKMFWETQGLNEFDTQDVVDMLLERSLARRDDQGCLTLHDLQYDYVRKQVGNLARLHNQLLMAYGKCCSNGWHTGQNDGYFFENLAYHLKESGRKEELYTLLTQSPDWMEAKFIACQGDTAYVADLQLAINDFADPVKPKQLLTLCQLQTARQVVNQRVRNYDDVDLETLVWLGRETEAINYARLREQPKSMFYGLLTISKALQARNQPQYILLNEIKEIAFSIQTDNWDKVNILIDLSLNLLKFNLPEETNTVIRFLEKIVNFSNIRNTYLLIKLGEIFHRLENIFEADKVFERALLVANNNDNIWHRANELCRLVATLSQLNRFEEAKKIANIINEDCIKVSALSEIALALIQKDLTIEAETIFTNIQFLIKTNEQPNSLEKEEWVNALGKFSLALTKTKKEKDADEFFTKARKIVDESSWWFRDRLQKYLVYFLSQAGRLDEAAKIALTIPEGNWNRVQALSTLANALAKLGQRQEAINVFMEAKKTASIAKGRRTIDAICNIALIMELSGYKMQSSLIFSKIMELVSSNEDEDEHEQIRIKSLLATAFAKVKCFNEAYNIILTLPSTNPFYINALSSLAISLEEDGKRAEADKIFHDMQQVAHQPMIVKSIDAQPQSTLVKALAQVNRIKHALQNTHCIKDEIEKVQALCAVAVALTNAGSKADADKIFREAQESANSIQSYGRREWAVWIFASALSEAGYFEEAKQEIKPLIHDQWHCSESLNGLAAPIAKSGYFVEAFTTLGLQTIDNFLYHLTEWASAFEKVQPNLSLKVMREAVRIARWIRPQWQEIYQIFPEITRQ